MSIYIIMGVAGCGKSTVGRAAADHLCLPYLEGDDFHSAHSVEKMRSGNALTNEDRMPWVDAMVAACLAQTSDQTILACSALSEVVRDRLRDGLNGACEFIHLHGDQAILSQRLSDRKGHFFKPDLLASQFAALDMPRDAIILDIVDPIEELVHQVVDLIRKP